MAIRAGMTIAEAILQLTKGFRKMMGRDPDGLEKIKIQQEAVKRIEEVNKVVDMEGNVIDTSKGIMGGKQIQDSPEFGSKIRETYDKAKGPGKGQEMVDALKSEGAQRTKSIMEDNLGMKLYGDETFEEILEIQKTGKHPRGEPKSGIMKATGAKPIEARADISKYIKDGKPDNDKLNALVDKDMILKEEADSLATKGENYERFQQISEERKNIREIIEDVRKMFPEDMAQGGRAGFKIGSIDKARRAFLKAAAGVGAGIGALKTGILGLTKGAAPVATEAVKSAGSTASAPPPYFFKLMEKIKFMGNKRTTPSYKERVNEYTYTGKDGSDYELIEDLDTGDIKITKDKIGGRSFEEGSYEVIEDRTEMVFRKGQADETTKGKTPPDEYDEYKVEFDQDGTAADATDIDEISKMEIVEEAGDPDSLTLKKAGGGIARMLGE